MFFSRSLEFCSDFSTSMSLLKDWPITKALTCMKNLPVQTKMAILSRRLILLAILLYEHYTQIILRPDKQLLSTQQQAYQSILSFLL